MSIRPNSDVVDVTRWTHDRLNWHLRICCDPALRDRAKLLASLLLHDFDLRKGGYAWRGQEGENSLSERAGWKDPKTVKLAAQELEAAGYIRVERAAGRGRSNKYWPVLGEAEKGDVRPGFEGSEKGDVRPGFEAEKGDADPVKPGRASPLHRKESENSLSAIGEREREFDRMVEACPVGMLQFADLGLARDRFEAICDTGQDPAVLTPALGRLKASEAYRTRKHPPQLHDWLGKGMWRGWLTDAEPTEPTEEARAAIAPFAGPPEVAEQLCAAADVGPCLRGAAWREVDRTVLTRSTWGRDELVRRVGPGRLSEMNIRVERAGDHAGQVGR